MPLSVEQFIQELADSGLMSDADIQVLRDIPRGMVESSGDLADSLVERGRLTAFQAKAVLNGDGQTLVLGNYTVLDRIGAGGMGVVLKALHRRMDREVALKILPKKAIDSEEAIRRFHREVKAAARLNHPNIVTAYDADEAGSVHFFVMEHVEGNNLSLLVRQNGTLPVCCGTRLHSASSARPGVRAQEGHHPSGHQARQHPARLGWCREDPRHGLGAN